MKISVFGLGYVGCVSAACLAHDGHTVIGIDANPQKVAQIQSGHATVMEPGLEEMVAEMVTMQRLFAVMSTEEAVHQSDVSLICVGTPSQGNGNLKLDYVEKVCSEIGRALASKRSYHVVVVRSTVLPGTVLQRLVPILEEYSRRCAGTDFGVSMNPEFLRESSAVADYYNPSQIVIGEFDQRSGDAVQNMYQAIKSSLVRVSITTAEMVKYVSNAFHALKVTFANEVGILSKVHGIDGREVMQIFCEDRRLNISPAYLQPGFAFGGSCLPKDLRALLYRAKECDLELPVLGAVLRSNQLQIKHAVEMIERTEQKRIGILGLSFKSGTNDVRESPVVMLTETLIGRGYQVRIYDDMVDPARLIGENKAFLERELPHIASLMRSSIQAVINETDVLVITNSSLSYQAIPGLMRDDQILIDLAGIHNVARGNYEGICW